MNEFSVILGSMLIYLPILVLLLAAHWKVYQKAGKPGWACIVPIYNLIVLCDIIEKPRWWVWLMILPYVNIVFLIWAWNRLALRFGKSVGFTIGMFFLPFIFWPILGFGSSTYTPLGE